MNQHAKGFRTVSTLMKDRFLDECRVYIDLMLKEIEGFSPGDRGRHEAASILANSLQKTKEREPLNSPLVMVARYISDQPSPVRWIDVYRAMRKSQLPSATVCSILRRYQWKRLTGIPLQKTRVVKKKAATAEPLPAEKALPIPQVASLATNSLPVEIQEATVKSILLEVAGIKITISYERKAGK